MANIRGRVWEPGCRILPAYRPFDPERADALFLEPLVFGLRRDDAPEEEECEGVFCEYNDPPDFDEGG